MLLYLHRTKTATPKLNPVSEEESSEEEEEPMSIIEDTTEISSPISEEIKSNPPSKIDLRLSLESNLCVADLTKIDEEILRTSPRKKVGDMGSRKMMKKLGQINKKVGLDEYNHKLVRMIKDKYHEELDRVDHFDLCDPNVTLLDLREKEDYDRGHIHNAINIPARLLLPAAESESTQTATKLLMEVHIDSLLKYSLAQKTSHVFIFYYYSKHRIQISSFFEVRKIRKLLRRALRIIEKSIIEHNEQFSDISTSRANFHLCVASSMYKKKYFKKKKF